MAFVVCDKHGGHAAPLVCPHLHDDVIHRRRISTVIRLDAEYLGDPAWCVHVCADCGAQHGFTESTIVPGDEGLDKVFEFDQQPVCSLCFDELRGHLAAD